MPGLIAVRDSARTLEASAEALVVACCFIPRFCRVSFARRLARRDGLVVDADTLIEVRRPSYSHLQPLSVLSLSLLLAFVSALLQAAAFLLQRLQPRRTCPEASAACLLLPQHRGS